MQKAGGIDKAMIKGVGIANQRETILCWDERGQPLYNAICWDDTRTQDMLGQFGEDFAEITGIPLSTYCSAPKIAWINNYLAETGIETEKRFFGNVNTWLVYKLCEGNPFCTEVSNAGCIGLMDLYKESWSPDLLYRFNVDVS
jgi:glycerol kinase